MPKLLWLFILFPLTAYCQPSNNATDYTIIESNELAYYSQSLGIEIKSLEHKKMFDAIITFMGTSYKYGGKNESGIDCSGFVNKVLAESGMANAGCSSADMYNNLKHINRSKLREGDLVFFRTRKKAISHVGIYLGENKFAHASTSNGVIISDLNEEYYQKRFAKGGRLKNN